MAQRVSALQGEVDSLRQREASVKNLGESLASIYRSGHE
jgi:hypothetical protein